MQVPVSQTLSNPAIGQAFMESFAFRVAEVHRDWMDKLRDMSATARFLDLDCHVVYRELERCMKRDLLRAEEAIQTLAQTKSSTWGTAQMNLEGACESLETEWLLWTVFSMR